MGKKSDTHTYIQTDRQKRINFAKVIKDCDGRDALYGYSKREEIYLLFSVIVIDDSVLGIFFVHQNVGHIGW